MSERSGLDRSIDHAAEAGITLSALMVSEVALEEIRRETSEDDWQRNHTHYRGVRIEHHDEWSWGWMLRGADGSFVSPTLSADIAKEGVERG